MVCLIITKLACCNLKIDTNLFIRNSWVRFAKS